jgi:hypothetical protein
VAQNQTLPSSTALIDATHLLSWSANRMNLPFTLAKLAPAASEAKFIAAREGCVGIGPQGF